MNKKLEINQTTLSVLNYDCLQHLLSFLPLIDKLIFAHCLVNDRVLEVVSKKDTFCMKDCLERLSVDETKLILRRFGCQIKHVCLHEIVPSEKKDYYELIATHCHSLEAIELHYPNSECELEIFRKILSANNSLESIWIERTLSEFRDELLAIIGNMQSIKNLYLSDLNDITGAQISQLTNLVELDISCCKLFDVDNFIKLMNGNNLKFLNIAYCGLLNDDAIQTLADTQQELEHLIISTTICAHNFKPIGQLKKLKEFVLYDFKGYKLMDAIEEIKNHPSIEVLKIINDFPYCGATGILLDYILSLKNLKVLFFPDDEDLNDKNLRALALNIPALKKLRIRIDDGGNVTYDGLIEVIRNLEHLQEFQIWTSTITFDSELLQQIIDTKIEANPQPLKIYWAAYTMEEDILNSQLYLDNLDILKVIPVNRWDDVEKLIHWEDAFR
ncbi:uncharacterized protein LOC119647838 [Hermetia illucens]|nr:uncharacterized protein LOC119647838 [Hermetia illucens]XP_037905017.1 uncharacterized protein LOC119647838 [Hermetia illucens]